MNERLPRRAFLGYASLGASAVWMPRWLTAGFAPARAQEPSAKKEKHPPLDLVLSQALERARAAGKPLLVLVVPAIQERAWERQTAFGQYLNLCDDGALADLALCEVVCARMSDLARVIRPMDFRGEPPVALVETDGADFVVRAFDAGLEEVSWPASGPTKEELEEAAREFERRVMSRVDRLAGLVRDAVAGDRETLERRASQTRAALGESAVELAERLVGTSADASAGDVDRVASLLRIAAESNVDRRDACIAALANAARSRLRLAPPAGAWWANHTGCGHKLEGRPEPYIGLQCGMGHVPELSRRFLHFYTTECFC